MRAGHLASIRSDHSTRCARDVSLPTERPSPAARVLAHGAAAGRRFQGCRCAWGCAPPPLVGSSPAATAASSRWNSRASRCRSGRACPLRRLLLQILLPLAGRGEAVHYGAVHGGALRGGDIFALAGPRLLRRVLQRAAIAEGERPGQVTDPV